MKRYYKILSTLLLFTIILCGTIIRGGAVESQTVFVPKIDNLSDNFITGADISSLLSLEKSGRVFYDFEGNEQDLLKTLSDSGINYIRVRVWNNPFDENGNGYGGGNCTVDTAIALGKRAAEYNMGLLVDFHYSDFWADPGKQQAPKAWKALSFDDKSAAIYDYTAESIRKIQNSGVKIGMVQIGNETTNGFCGETDIEKRCALMNSASKAVRDTDSSILIATHFTNPERKLYPDTAQDLKNYNVDYDIFATSFYPEYHGTVYNLKEQLEAVHNLTGKKVMIAETSWAYTSSIIGAYKSNVQGQVDEIADCAKAMAELGDYALGIFYWEPAWIDVPGDTEAERNQKREIYGAGWASSYAGSYDPDDAGKYYGATACIPSSLFDPEGHPLESLKTFRYIRQGVGAKPDNYILNPSFEENGAASWTITEKNAGTTNISSTPTDARDGVHSLHFWNDKEVSFTAEQEIKNLSEGKYTFSLSAQGDTGENASVKIYAVSGGKRYEQSFKLDGWRCWKVPMIKDIPCTNGSIMVGIEIKADAEAWGTIDDAELLKEQSKSLRGDVNDDSRVDILDATLIQKRVALLKDINETAADVDGDGEITVKDASAIQRYLAKMENTCLINSLIY